MENLKGEIWKDVKGYEGLYQVSSMGRIKGLKRTTIRSNGSPMNTKERILKGYHSHGYYMVRLVRQGCVNGKGMSVHRLVAIAFLENKKNKNEVNHIDHDRGNAKLSNLEWVSPKENMKKALKFGAIKLGDKRKNAKITTKQALGILEMLKTQRIIDIHKSTGISYSIIQSIKSGTRWKHLTTKH